MRSSSSDSSGGLHRQLLSSFTLLFTAFLKRTTGVFLFLTNNIFTCSLICFTCASTTSWTLGHQRIGATCALILSLIQREMAHYTIVQICTLTQTLSELPKMCHRRFFNVTRTRLFTSLFTETSDLDSFLPCLFPCGFLSSLSHACLRPCTSDFSSRIHDLQRSPSVMIYLLSSFDRTSAASVVQAPCQNKLALCNLHQPFSCFTKWEPHRTCNSVTDQFRIDSLCDLHCQHHQHLCKVQKNLSCQHQVFDIIQTTFPLH